MEYRFIDSADYYLYQQKANYFLNEVSRYFNLSFTEITSKHVIDYFERKYNILFVFLDVDQYEEYFRDIGGRQATREDIKYKGIVNNCKIKFVPKEFCDPLSGVTMTYDCSDRYVVYINQRPILGRVMFSILHELSHIFAHFEGNKKQRMYASMMSNVSNISTGNYPKELQPIEDEANTLASLFLLNDERLKNSILNDKNFNDLIRENYMSGAAIMNRLKNFLVYNYCIPIQEAVQIVLDYRNGYNSTIQSIVF
ncbi:ImmA/IrrE family metallo-endopeptidase [Streptococcus gallolyticus]|uniref:ImmA/IrrE family metallo-endopeptidase n=1 Tax=Streptococcus gallolyticus TaxID=315405 RepID=A0AAE6YRW4_9STRE|nr:ImmA/IrrE family metallo-endopeptidase [Streptococcus gallolyticus]QIX74524.1 ImmA/IrrE family metallo-endopeptidase [Streptococcus gallolyticus]